MYSNILAVLVYGVCRRGKGSVLLFVLAKPFTSAERPVKGQEDPRGRKDVLCQPTLRYEKVGAGEQL